MTPTRKRRLIAVGLILLAVGVAATLTVFALQQNMNYLLTPVQVKAGEADRYTTFRLGGMVKAGSIQRSKESLEVAFTVIDGDAELPVHYTGILPDLFRENQAVIATGSLKDGMFVSTEVLAKHDENYMPKELADAMGKAHVKHDVAMPATSPSPQR
ncbi:MAG: cytochrome c maturation protein CcmE [Dokdonella sp.]